MTSRQSQYYITYDDFNDSYLCDIDGETISANCVGEILSYIDNWYDLNERLFIQKCIMLKC